jgi:hypothetical protein
MRHGSFLKLATTAVIASAVLATACTERGPSDLAGPGLKPGPLFNLVTTTTNWDFVALAGGEGPQGNSKTFTIAGVGSVVASAAVTNPASEVFSKGFALSLGDEERGLGLCQDIGFNNLCVGWDDEIGDLLTTGTVLTPLTLNLTGLNSGCVATGVTLSSVQLGEGYSVSSSNDGINYSLVQAGVGTGAAVFTIPVSGAPTYLRFDVGAGVAGNNYLLQSMSVDCTTNTGGKTFTIGPSSMEGAILISNGDWVNGGYSFKFVNSTHPATNFSVHAFVSLSGPCIGGGPATDTFTFPLNDATYAVPANNTNWLPTGDANSVLSWEGSVIASGVCGGIGQLDARHGAVFTATVSQNPPSGSLVDFRFKYRDPKAKGKPNTNCLDTSDPNRAKADVCGASWSQTVRDP